MDLMNDCVDQGEELKKTIGAVTYIECSSKTQQVKIVALVWIQLFVLYHIIF